MCWRARPILKVFVEKILHVLFVDHIWFKLSKGDRPHLFLWLQFLSFVFQWHELIVVKFAGHNVQCLILELLLKSLNQSQEDSWLFLFAQDWVGLSWVGYAVAKDQSWFTAIFEELNEWRTDVISESILADCFVKDLVKGIGFGNGLRGIVQSDHVHFLVDFDLSLLLVLKEGFQSTWDRDVLHFGRRTKVLRLVQLVLSLFERGWPHNQKIKFIIIIWTWIQIISLWFSFGSLQSI